LESHSSSKMISLMALIMFVLALILFFLFETNIDSSKQEFDFNRNLKIVSQNDKNFKNKKVFKRISREKIDLFEKIDFKKFSEALRFSESSNKQFVINSGGYLGWYQIGLAQLEDLGYVENGEYERMRKSGLGQRTFIKNYVVWSKGLNLKKFLSFKQKEAFKRICKNNYTSLKKFGFLKKVKDHKELQGILFGAHLVGLDKTKKWLNGKIVSAKDGNNVSIQEYFKKGQSI